MAKLIDPGGDSRDDKWFLAVLRQGEGAKLWQAKTFDSVGGDYSCSSVAAVAGADVGVLHEDRVLKKLSASGEVGGVVEQCRGKVRLGRACVLLRVVPCAGVSRCGLEPVHRCLRPVGTAGRQLGWTYPDETVASLSLEVDCHNS